MIFLFLLSVGLVSGQKAEPDSPTNEEPVHPSEVAFQKFYRAKKEIEETYRKDLSKVIELAEIAEIVLLDFEVVKDFPKNGSVISNQILPDDEQPNEDPELESALGELEKAVGLEKGDDVEYFPIKPNGTLSKVLQRKILDKKAMGILRQGVVDLLQQPDRDTSPWCHYPIHAIRLADKNNNVIFETSVCYACGNYFLRYPDEFKEASWIDFKSEILEAFWKKEMPIPQTEIDRFKAKHGR